MKISVICVYNDKTMFENQLLQSLKMQDIKYELIGLDNSIGKFKSAAAALNYGAGIAQGNILIFSHQDIYLKTNDALKIFARQLERCNAGTIIGTQGVIEKSKIYYSNLTAGSSFNSLLIHDFENILYDVSCVDEGFFGMTRETFFMHPFNEVLCDNWHLYCVEMCLYMRKNGGNVYVCPIQLHHYSYGTISLSYMKGLKALCNEYREDFKYIWTTCYKVKTNRLYINLLILLWCLNRIVRRKSLG